MAAASSTVTEVSELVRAVIRVISTVSPLVDAAMVARVDVADIKVLIKVILVRSTEPMSSLKVRITFVPSGPGARWRLYVHRRRRTPNTGDAGGGRVVRGHLVGAHHRRRVRGRGAFSVRPSSRVSCGVPVMSTASSKVTVAATVNRCVAVRATLTVAPNRFVTAWLLKLAVPDRRESRRRERRSSRVTRRGDGGARDVRRDAGQGHRRSAVTVNTSAGYDEIDLDRVPAVDRRRASAAPG